jgi:DNA-binding NarL/FixJ family response regulator
MTPIRVLIVDDQHLVRDGIASLLALQQGIAVVGTAENGRVAVSVVKEQAPDVVLMDIRMPVMDGITAVEEIRRAGSTTRILMLTTFDDEEYVVKSLRAGANGYLMKDLPTEDLARAIAQVYAGTYQIAPGVIDSLLNRVGDGVGGDTSHEDTTAQGSGAPIDPEVQRMWQGLSDRERDVLRLLGRGATNGEIAKEVHLSPGTVKNYVSEILTALELRDRTQAALLAVKYGWDR